MGQKITRTTLHVYSHAPLTDAQLRALLDGIALAGVDTVDAVDVVARIVEEVDTVPDNNVARLLGLP